MISAIEYEIAKLKFIEDRIARSSVIPSLEDIVDFAIDSFKQGFNFEEDWSCIGLPFK